MTTRREITHRIRYAARCFKVHRKVQRTYQRTLRWLTQHGTATDVRALVSIYRRTTR